MLAGFEDGCELGVLVNVRRSRVCVSMILLIARSDGSLKISLACRTIKVNSGVAAHPCRPTPLTVSEGRGEVIAGARAKHIRWGHDDTLPRATAAVLLVYLHGLGWPTDQLVHHLSLGRSHPELVCRFLHLPSCSCWLLLHHLLLICSCTSR